MSEIIENNSFIAYVDVNDLITREVCEEWETTASIDFILNKYESFTIFGHEYCVKGGRFCNMDWSGDEFELVYIIRIYEDKHAIMHGVDVDSKLVREILSIIKAEEAKGKSGWLKNHVFSDCYCFEGYDWGGYNE